MVQAVEFTHLPAYLRFSLMPHNPSPSEYLAFTSAERARALPQSDATPAAPAGSADGRDASGKQVGEIWKATGGRDGSCRVRREVIT